MLGARIVHQNYFILIHYYNELDNQALSNIVLESN